jgi:hypothetical protein
MENDKGLETETEVEQTVTPVQPEVKPPTTEDLQKEIKELKTKYEQTDKGLRSAQATLTQKDRLIKEKEISLKRLDTLEDSMQILAGLIVKGNIDPEQAESYKKEFADLKAKRQKEEEQLALKAKQEEYQTQINTQVKSLQDRVEALGLTEDDERYLEIKRLAENATPTDFKLADIKLKKIEKEKKPVDTKPIDDKDKTIADLQAKLKKLEMGKSGQLDVETGLPTGSGSVIPTDITQFRQWIATIPQDVYEKEYASKVNEMRRLGQIK